MEENAILQGEKAAGNVLLHSTRSASSFGAKDEPIGKDLTHSVEGGAVAGSRSESAFSKPSTPNSIPRQSANEYPSTGVDSPSAALTSPPGLPTPPLPATKPPAFHGSNLTSNSASFHFARPARVVEDVAPRETASSTTNSGAKPSDARGLTGVVNDGTARKSINLSIRGYNRPVPFTPIIPQPIFGRPAPFQRQFGKWTAMGTRADEIAAGNPSHDDAANPTAAVVNELRSREGGTATMENPDSGVSDKENVIDQV